MSARGPMPRWGDGKAAGSRHWPVWRVVRRSYGSGTGHEWQVWAPGRSSVRDRAFTTHAEALAYALEQSGANQPRLPEVCS